MIEAIETSVKLKVTRKDVFSGSEPPPVWISRAINPPSHSFCRGGVDFFWNDPLFKEKITANQSWENLLFFHLIDMQNVPSAHGFLSMK